MRARVNHRPLMYASVHTLVRCAHPGSLSGSSYSPLGASPAGPRLLVGAALFGAASSFTSGDDGGRRPGSFFMIRASLNREGGAARPQGNDDDGAVLHPALVEASLQLPLLLPPPGCGVASPMARAVDCVQWRGACRDAGTVAGQGTFAASSMDANVALPGVCRVGGWRGRGVLLGKGREGRGA